MTNELIFKIDRENTLVDTRLTEPEIRLALQELKRLAAMEWPNADATVLPITLNAQ